MVGLSQKAESIVEILLMSKYANIGRKMIKGVFKLMQLYYRIGISLAVGMYASAGWSGTTKVEAVELSNHTFTLQHTIVIKRLDGGYITMNADRIAETEVRIQDGAGGTNTQLISATPSTASNAITCDVSHGTGNIWNVRMQMHIRPDQQGKVVSLGASCALKFQVKNAPSAYPRTRTRGVAIKFAGSGNISNAMGFRDVSVHRPGAGYHDDISATYNDQGVQPTPLSNFAQITIGRKDVVQPAANLTIQSVDQMTLTPAIPRQRAITVTGSGSAMGTWSSNTNPSKITLVDAQGNRWETGVPRAISSGNTYDIQLVSPNTLGWGQWHESVNIEWSIQ